MWEVEAKAYGSVSLTKGRQAGSEEEVETRKGKKQRLENGFNRLKV